MERIKDFVSIIVNPIWKWVVEIFMGLLSIIIYVKPEWADWLSFSNLIKDYWWAWFIGGTIIWIFSTAWQYANEKAETKKTPEKVSSHKTLKQDNRDGSLGFQGNTFNAPVIFGELDNQKRDNLNKLGKFLKTAIDDILDYGMVQERTDKRTRIERKDVAYKSIDSFKEFSENHIAEMSPQLNKLIFDKMLPEMEKVMRSKMIFWNVFNTRKELVEQNLTQGRLPELPETSDEKMLNLQKEIHEEIYRVLNG